MRVLRQFFTGACIALTLAPLASGPAFAAPPAGSSAAALPAPNYLDRTQLPKMVACIARIRSKTGSCAINLLGHSELMGQGAGTADSIGGLTVGASKYSLAATLATALTQRGLPARRSAIFGTSLSGGTAQSFNDLLAYDTRITRTGGSFAFDGGGGSSGGSIGGWLIRAPTAAGTLTETFEEPWDRLVSYYAGFNGGGTYTIDTGGAILATTNTSQTTTGLYSVAVSAASDIVQPINFKPTVLGTANAGVYFVGAETYQSAVSEIRIRQLAQSGIQSSKLNSTEYTYSWGSALTALGGDATIIPCFRNDEFAQVSPATVQANLTAAGQRAAAFGDVIFFIDHEPNPSDWNAPNFAANDASYIAAVQAAATAVRASAPAGSGVVVINIPALMGSGVSTKANGFLGPDGIHFGKIGQFNYGGIIAAIIAGLA